MKKEEWKGSCLEWKPDGVVIIMKHVKCVKDKIGTQYPVANVFVDFGT